MVETKYFCILKTSICSKTEQIRKKNYIQTYESKYNYYLFYIPSVDINALYCVHLSDTNNISSRSFKQPPSPLYVYGFLHSFFKSFLIQCSRTWSKTPKHLGFGTRIDHFHNHFGTRIIDFFFKQALLESSCYNDGGRFGQALVRILLHRWRFQRLAGKDLLLRWMFFLARSFGSRLETPRNTMLL